MIGGPNGATPGWQYAMVFFFIVVFLIVVLGMKLPGKDDWRKSKTLKVMMVGGVVAIGLAVWYRVDSNDMWVALAHRDEAIELFIDTPGVPEIVEIRGDRIPTIWWPNRPDRTRPCQSNPFSSSGGIEISGTNFLSHFERVERQLQDKGWDTLLMKPPESDAVRLWGFMGDRSVFFFEFDLDGDDSTTTIAVEADWACRSESADYTTE